jgi:hypothetical protein
MLRRPTEDDMPKFIIEREMPQVGKLTDNDFKVRPKILRCARARTGGLVDRELCHCRQDFCVYHAPDEKLIREHAKRSGFPASKITKVERVIDPTTAERRVMAQAAA